MKKGQSIKTLLNASEPQQNVTVYGWIRQKRTSKGVVFIEINDGSVITNIQVVTEKDHPQFEFVRDLAIGSSVKIEGDLVDSPAKGQRYELRMNHITLFGTCDETYPMQKKRHSFEFLRQIAHLRVRSNTFGAVFRVRSEAAFAIHDFFHSEGFFYVHTPIITGLDCEGAGEMFTVTTLPLENVPLIETENGNYHIDFSKDFFKRKTGLTVSGQLEAEMLALALSKVYTFGPTFRAENSNTPRHAAEFWMIEPEMAFYDLDDTIQLAELFIKRITEHILSKCSEDLNFFEKWIDRSVTERLKALVKSPFRTLTYSEAVRLLEKSEKSFEFPVYWGMNLQAEHERYITEEVFGCPVFARDYPLEIKAFYMRLNDDEKTVSAVDLIVPKIGEMIGGSQREERLDVLKRLFEIKELSTDEYWWYLDTRRYGTAPHSGFGLGFERLIQYLTGMNNIRDVTPFPRTPGNAEF